MPDQTLDICGRRLKVSNLDKVLYPRTGFTKAQVIDYYIRIAPVLLPHLRGRPVTMIRYPDGIGGGHFFEKNCPAHRPDWVPVVSMPRKEGGATNYCLFNDQASLVWSANLAAIELHPHLHYADDLERPTMLVFDLDPGLGRTLIDCGKLALKLRDVLARFDLQGMVKASGGKGLHLYVPLNTSVTYDRTRAFANALANLMQKRHPDQVTSNMSKHKRAGRILIDWSQNNAHKTTAGVYTLRARAAPSVSIPLAWEEIEALARKRKHPGIDMSPQAAIERMDQRGDLFEPMLALKQTLPEFSG